MADKALYEQLLKENFQKLDVSLKTLQLSIEKCLQIGIKETYSFEETEAFDSLTSKFARTSDIFIQKILRSVFILLHEGALNLIDLANRAEKLNLITNADTLLMIRDIRNQISHEYEDENLKIIYSQIFELAKWLESDIEKTRQFAGKYQWLKP